MIIGIGGKIKVGKSTMAKRLCEEHGFVEMSFSKNLKEMCKASFGLSDDQVYTQEGKEELFTSPLPLLPAHLMLIDGWIRHRTPRIVVNKYGLSSSIESFIDERRQDPVTFESPREIIQFVGTEICRDKYSQSYHVDVIDEQVKETAKDIVLSDARFVNERAYIKEKGGFTVKIVAPSKEDNYVGIKGHQSENIGDDDDYDLVLFNNKDAFEVFHAMIDETLKNFKDEVFSKHI